MEIDTDGLHPEMVRFLKRTSAKQDWSDSTLRIRADNLRSYNEWREEQGFDLVQIDPIDLEDHLIAMHNEGYAPNTISNRYATLRLFYQYLADIAGKREENPFEDVERSEMMRGTKKNEKTDVVYVTADEKEELVEHAPEPRLRNRLMIRLLWQTGIRQSEAAIIGLNDIDRDDRSIRIYAPKTDSTRTVFYQQSLDLLLDQWLDHGYRDSVVTAPQSEYLFPSPQSEHISPSRIGKMVAEAAENAGIQEVLYVDAMGRKKHRIGGHTLRHSHAVAALKRGLDLRWIQEHMGHASIDTTEQYTRVLDDDVREAYREFAGSSPAQT
jgi:integrase/recombinase XerD